jgi:hypothetical protein
MKHTFILPAMVTILSTLSFSAFSHNTVYTAGDDSTESTLCVIAANEGISAAKSYARNERINFARIKQTVSCDGLTIHEMARKAQADQYGQHEMAQDDIQQRILFIATNDDADTQLCIEAAKRGTQSGAYALAVRKNIACNGQGVAKFVRSLRQGS